MMKKTNPTPQDAMDLALANLAAAGIRYTEVERCGEPNCAHCATPALPNAA